MTIYILSGNLSTGKTRFAEVLKQSDSNIRYLSVDLLVKNLNMGSMDKNNDLIGISQGLIKDFIRRSVVPSTTVAIETTMVSSRSRKSLITMIKNVLKELSLDREGACTIALRDFGPGDQSSLERAVSQPEVLAGGENAKRKVVDMFSAIQRSYETPKIEEGWSYKQ